MLTTTTATVINQQSSKQDLADFVTDKDIENALQASNDTKLDLSSILVSEFGQGLASDIVSGF